MSRSTAFVNAQLVQAAAKNVEEHLAKCGQQMKAKALVLMFLAVNLTITWPIVVSDEVKIDP